MKIYKGTNRVTVVMTAGGANCPALSVKVNGAQSRIKDDYYGKVSIGKGIINALTLL